jgi:asparagine synthetase B (glutamine-hydrolysing)
MKKSSLLNEGRAAALLEAALWGALASHRRVDAVMFSGGFDSVLLYERARSLFPGVVAVTLALGSYNRRTVLEARRSAKRLGARHCVVPVSVDEYLDSSLRVHRLLKGKCDDRDLPLVHAGLKKLPLSLKYFLAGMGSDQWLGEKFDAKGRLSLMQQRRAARSTVKTHVVAAADVKREIFFPFLDKSVLDVAVRLPPALRKGKRLLRALAPELSGVSPVSGLPPEIQVPLAVRSLAARCRARVKDARG